MKVAVVLASLLGVVLHSNSFACDKRPQSDDLPNAKLQALAFEPATDLVQHEGLNLRQLEHSLWGAIVCDANDLRIWDIRYDLVTGNRPFATVIVHMNPKTGTLLKVEDITNNYYSDNVCGQVTAASGMSNYPDVLTSNRGSTRLVTQDPATQVNLRKFYTSRTSFCAAGFHGPNGLEISSLQAN